MSRASTTREREELMAKLAAMEGFLRDAFGSLTREQARAPGSGGSFSPVEHVWHLADLEREGFGVRIRRLLAETDPHLPDFDGAKVARERNYRALAIDEGLRAFAAARAANLRTLEAQGPEAWTRRGTQEGVGPVSLGDMPALLHHHDRSHMAEIGEWRKVHSAPGPGMEVVDHEPHGWFLLREGPAYFLDVNCSVSAVGFGMLIRLADAECEEYRRLGRAFILSLAAKVQDGPGGYAARDLTRTHGEAVGKAIASWRSRS